jgi:hypothetical protein
MDTKVCDLSHTSCEETAGGRASAAGDVVFKQDRLGVPLTNLLQHGLLFV